MREYARQDRGQAIWHVSRALSKPPGEVVQGVREGDPEMSFAVASEAERYDRELKKWEATWNRLEAIQKTIAKAFRK